MNNFVREAVGRRQAILILSSQKRTDSTGVRVYCDALERMFQSIDGVDVIRVCWSDVSPGWQKLAVLLRKASRVLGRGTQQTIRRWVGGAAFLATSAGIPPSESNSLGSGSDKWGSCSVDGVEGVVRLSLF